MDGAMKISDRMVKDLEPPAKGNRLTYDDEINGFAVRITKGGAKAFVLNYYVAGRERRITIGKYPDWTVAAARAKAKELRRAVDDGDDPLAERIEKREAPTVGDLWDAYQAKHLPTKRKRSGDDDASMWRDYILPRFRNVKLTNLTAEQVDDMHREIGRSKPVRANRVIDVLRKAINLAIRWKWIAGDNPASGVQKFTEEKRERYAVPEEISKLLDEMVAHREQDSVDAIRLIILTGARKGEVFKARWADIELTAGIWTKPSAHTKQQKFHRVPLSGAAIDLLARRKESRTDATWVFPGRIGGQPITDVKRTWETIRTRATFSIWTDHQEATAIVDELKATLKRQPTVEEVEIAAGKRSVAIPNPLVDLTIHDLRHTFASLLASRKTPLQVIGALLGHTQAQTTLRYAHLYDDPQREGTEVVARLVNGEGVMKEPEAG
jgi:integrase